MKKRYLSPIPLLLLLAQISLAVEDTLDKSVKDDLTQLTAANIPVLVTECLLKQGKASLVFPVGEKRGLFIELSDKAVVNFATLDFEEGKFHIELAQGGVYTNHRAFNLIEELMAAPFRLLRADKISEILALKPKRKCVEKLPQ